MENNNQTKSPLLLTLIILTLLAIAQQGIRVWRNFSFMLESDPRSTTSYIKHLFVAHHLSLAPPILLLAAQLLLYALLVIAIYCSSRLIGNLFNLSDSKQYVFGILFWFVTTLFILIANSFFFPHSSFAIPVNTLLLGTITTILGIIISITIILAIIELFHRHWIYWSIITLLILTLSCYYLCPHANKYLTSADTPNIVIIGLDSIRPDHVKFYNNTGINTPNIDTFLSKATAFTQAYSPLARTYVAWNVILQGLYPKHNGVRDNLIDPDSLNLTNTLANILKRHGYETIFATDSRQFSLITKSFGFDKIASPKMGVYDFIFSLVNDFPLSNLVMNTPLGHWLFPYNYANRMSYITYRPQTFNSLLKQTLARRNNRPLFLGMHLVLTHWPFLWAKDYQNTGLATPIEYNDTLERIDTQLQRILKILKQDNILKHAIVILISDHGLGLGLPRGRVIARQTYIGNLKDTKVITKYAYSPIARRKGMPYLTLNTSDGEGTDVLGFNRENHIIFGIRTYGIPLKNRIAKISTPIALIDITPTILDLLNLAPKQDVDGISLKQFILTNGHANSLLKRALFFETGIWMPLFNVKDLKTGGTSEYILKKFLSIFAFKAKGNLIVVDPKKLTSLLASKQRGILYDNWFLARYPKGPEVETAIIPRSESQKMNCALTRSYGSDENGPVVCYRYTDIQKPYYILVNLKNHKWTMEFDTSFAKNSPLRLMMQKLKLFYGTEI